MSLISKVERGLSINLEDYNLLLTKDFKLEIIESDTSRIFIKCESLSDNSIRTSINNGELKGYSFSQESGRKIINESHYEVVESDKVKGFVISTDSYIILFGLSNNSILSVIIKNFSSKITIEEATLEVN